MQQTTHCIPALSPVCNLGMTLRHLGRARISRNKHEEEDLGLSERKSNNWNERNSSKIQENEGIDIYCKEEKEKEYIRTKRDEKDIRKNVNMKGNVD
jgi:hypothetical protein